MFIVSVMENTHCVGKIPSFLNTKTDCSYSYHCFKALICPLINTSCGLAALGGGVSLGGADCVHSEALG